MHARCTSTSLVSGVRARRAREAEVFHFFACLLARPIGVAAVDHLLALTLDRLEGSADISNENRRLYRKWGPRGGRYGYNTESASNGEERRRYEEKEQEGRKRKRRSGRLNHTTLT